DVPSRFGLGIKAYTKKLEKAGFTVDTNYVYSDGVPRGGFVGWSASSGSRAPQYSTIYKLYSQGRDPEKVAAEKAAKKKAASDKKKAAAKKKKAAAKKKAEEEAKKKAEGGG
ncbi:MAG TPA: hypothetical protein VEX57_12875, partial [Microlunatus sp.]|nr:hypothetical protein [Microlunatus sp.]